LASSGSPSSARSGCDYDVTDATLPLVEASAWLGQTGPSRSASHSSVTSRRSRLSHRRTERKPPDASGHSPKPSTRRSGTPLAVRDSDAPVIADRKGRPEPDPGPPRQRERPRCPGPVEELQRGPDPPSRLPALSRRRRCLHGGGGPPFSSPTPWVDHTKTKIGYEIPLTRHFYRYVPPRPARGDPTPKSRRSRRRSSGSSARSRRDEVGRSAD